MLLHPAADAEGALAGLNAYCACRSPAFLLRRPNLGPRAFTAGWHFDFTVAYVGAGFITPLSVRCARCCRRRMQQCEVPCTGRCSNTEISGACGRMCGLLRRLCGQARVQPKAGMTTVSVSRQVNYSMMVGAILSWGFAWPLVRNRAGDWYPILPAATASYSFQGFAAYPVFWSLGLYLGDGGYQMIKMCAPPTQ